MAASRESVTRRGKRLMRSCLRRPPRTVHDVLQASEAVLLTDRLEEFGESAEIGAAGLGQPDREPGVFASQIDRLPGVAEDRDHPSFRFLNRAQPFLRAAGVDESQSDRTSGGERV